MNEMITIDQEGIKIKIEESDYNGILADEVRLIQEPILRNTVMIIVSDIMSSPKVKATTIRHTRKVVKIAREIANVRGYTNMAIDVVTAASILHDLYKDKEGELHPIMIRLKHKETLTALPEAIAESLCAMIEGHKGYNSIIPRLASKEGSIDQILTDANAIAHLEL
jgi:HD superfamily phosphodiesterase